MRCNAAGLTIIKEYEPFRNEPYRDKDDIWRIGYGCTLGMSEKAAAITAFQGDELLAREIEDFEPKLGTLIDGCLTDNQWSATVSLAFDITLPAFRRSPLRQYINAGYFDPSKIPNAPDEFLLCTEGRSKDKKGRRKSERQLFVQPILVIP